MNFVRTFFFLSACCMVATAANAAVYMQNFDGFPDGTTVLGDGSTISSNDVTNSVQSTALRMTQDGVNSTWSSFRIPSLMGSSSGWVATFDFSLADAQDNFSPADGFSFNYGAIPALTSPGTFTGAGEGNGEEGFNAGGGGNFANLSFEVDTWDNFVDENGYNIALQGPGADSNLAFQNTDILLDGGTLLGSAVLSWNPIDGASMSIDSGGGLVAIFSNFATPGFTGLDSYSFAFSARTGGANETLTIDNIVISTQFVPEPATLALLGVALAGLSFSRRKLH